MTESAPERVVLDSNVVLSALVFRKSVSSRFRHLWQRGVIAPRVSEPTVRELLRVLAYPKFRLSAQEREELLGDYLPFTTTVRPEDHRNALMRLPICRDPHDDMFLELAQAGDAAVLVTGDQDLLELNDPSMRRMGFTIVAPTEALKRWVI